MKRRVIVTFKKKDTRSNPEPDKLELLAEAVGVRRCPVAGASYGPMPRGLDLDNVVYDVDEYEAPIVVAALDDDQIEAVRGAEDVATVEEDGPMFALGRLVIEGQPSVLEETVPAGIAAIKAPAAWDASRGKAMKVAVLDTGIDPVHPDLVANLRMGMSFVSSETSTDDFNGHGTHVAGTIAAAHDQIGVVGVAPAAALYPVKVLDRNGRGQWSNLIAGIDWCINSQDIRVLNMSLGGPAAPVALEQMCALAWERGRLLVAAAGNDGGPVGYPAKWESVVAVSALDGAGMIAAFSNRGPEVELSAPGVDVLSTVPGGRVRHQVGYQHGQSPRRRCGGPRLGIAPLGRQHHHPPPPRLARRPHGPDGPHRRIRLRPHRRRSHRRGARAAAPDRGDSLSQDGGRQTADGTADGRPIPTRRPPARGEGPAAKQRVGGCRISQRCDARDGGGFRLPSRPSVFRTP